MKENTIYRCFAKRVKENPDAMAILEKEQALTYAQLDRRADDIAGYFPRPAAFIGIVADHGADMAASILAALKTGAAYVPAEPDFPVERIRFMMKESGVDFIITQQKYADRLSGFPLLLTEDIGTSPEKEAAPCPAGSAEEAAPCPTGSAEEGIPCSAAPDSPAYVLYTSGST